MGRTWTLMIGLTLVSAVICSGQMDQGIEPWWRDSLRGMIGPVQAGPVMPYQWETRYEYLPYLSSDDALGAISAGITEAARRTVGWPFNTGGSVHAEPPSLLPCVGSDLAANIAAHTEAIDSRAAQIWNVVPQVLIAPENHQEYILPSVPPGVIQWH